jgi:hypothetical protein
MRRSGTMKWNAAQIWRHSHRWQVELRDGSTIGNSIGGVTSMLQRILVTRRGTWR